MWRNGWLALSVLSMAFVGACSGGTDTEETDKTGDDDDDTEPEHSVSTAGYIPVEYVGFSIETGLMSDGSLSNWMYSGYDIPPSVYLTFVDLDYFYVTSAQQDAHQCLVGGTWTPTPLADPSTMNAAMSLDGGSPSEMRVAWEDPLIIEFTTCNGLLDPALWGENGYDLIGNFYGARFGMGLGPMTSSFTDPLVAYGWTTDDIEFMNTYYQLEYVALRGADGTYIANPWSITDSLQWDETTKELTVTDGYFTRLDTSAGLVSSVILGDPWWYAGFYELDMGNLQEGAR